MTETTITATRLFVPAECWDIPKPDRGWLKLDDRPAGFFLDYGPDHYRHDHRYCQPHAMCVDCEPGTVLAVLPIPADPGPGNVHRWFTSTTDAMAWIESHAEVTR